MEPRVTTFRLIWQNNGQICVDDVAREEITVRRRDCSLQFCVYNGGDELIDCEYIKPGKQPIEQFFDFLSGIRCGFEPDYMVEVCDGSEWTMQILDSSRRVQKVYGSVEYPPYGRKIEEYLMGLIESGKGHSIPTMFGCDR